MSPVMTGVVGTDSSISEVVAIPLLSMYQAMVLRSQGFTVYSRVTSIEIGMDAVDLGRN
jgi:hypothetical protein